VAELGPVDMLINSAGTSFPGEFDSLSIDQFRVSIHLAFDLCKYKAWKLYWYLRAASTGKNVL